MNLTPVIIAGGIGSRLWPMSRSTFPKQFISIDGERSLLQNTILRFLELGLNDPIIVCNVEHKFTISSQLEEFDINPTIILEPEGRNTAPAIALAAMLAKQDDKLFITSSDLALPEKKDVSSALKTAYDLSHDGKIITFGVTPTEPNTGYGYIRCSSSANNAYNIEHFEEKPSYEKALQYLQTGNYFWNSGMFLFTAKDYINELKLHAPDIHKICKQSIIQSSKNSNFLQIPFEIFNICPSESIDYAVMEKTSNALMVRLHGSWNDLGTWSSVWEHLEKDENKNVVSENTYTFDTFNSLILADKKLVISAGLDNIIAVDTKDALLIADKKNLDFLKSYTKEAAELNNHIFDQHSKVFRPWGHFESLDSDIGFQVKRLTVYPSQKLSVQKHKYRSEHWVVVSGQATVLKDKETINLNPNESIYIPAGCIHSLENNTSQNIEIIEVQTGSYLGEDDIIRYEDRYGRIPDK
jgi:mannose-1-phosphate guanylyltransferase